MNFDLEIKSRNSKSQSVLDNIDVKIPPNKLLSTQTSQIFRKHSRLLKELAQPHLSYTSRAKLIRKHSINPVKYFLTLNPHLARSAYV